MVLQQPASVSSGNTKYTVKLPKRQNGLCMSRIGPILLKFGIVFPKSHAKMKTLFQWLAEHSESISLILL
jgi:hypothetical protein